VAVAWIATHNKQGGKRVGLFDKWLNKPKNPRDMEKHAIRWIDRYDEQDLEQIKRDIRDYRLKREKLIEAAPNTGGNLTGDSVMSYFKVGGGELEDEAKMNPQFLLNWAVANGLAESTEAERLRAWTEDDIIGSGMAFVATEREIEALYDKAKTHEEQLQQAEQQMLEYLEAQEGQRQLEDMIQEWVEQGELTDEEHQSIEQMQQAIAAAMDQAAEEIKEQGDDLEQKLGGAISAGMPALRQALNNAADEAQELAEAARAFGTDPGELKKMDAKARLALAKKLNDKPEFKKLADLIGPLRNLATTEQTRKVHHAPEEVYDVEEGNDLSKLLPQEFLALDDPVYELDFQRKYLEGKLQQYKMQGTEKVGKGAIIFEMDNSGSMAGPKEVWAKATGLGCLHIAKEQKRAFWGIHFATRHQLKVFDFSTPDKITFDRVIEYAEHFFNGGTDFEAPLNAGLKLLQEEFNQKQFVSGDIVFVTDGECEVSPQWLKSFKAEQERLKFKVYGILVPNPGSVLDRKTEPLWTICDGNVVTIGDLLSGNDVRDMFQTL
jgi:uncharacterized protein with von Willebrand factor type A (vWA) domain